MFNDVSFDDVRWEEVLSWIVLFLPFTIVLFSPDNALWTVLAGLIMNVPVQRFLMWRLAKIEDRKDETVRYH